MNKHEWLEVAKKMGILLFIGGFLFAQPIIQAIGAIGWGIALLVDLFTAKKKRK